MECDNNTNRLTGTLFSCTSLICNQWKDGSLDLAKVRSLLAYMTREALIFMIATPRATVDFQKVVGLDPLILNLTLKSLVEPVKREIRSWVQVRQFISSPFARPQVKDWDFIQHYFSPEQGKIAKLKHLKPYFDDSCTLYEIAAHSNCYLFDLALDISRNSDFLKGIIDKLLQIIENIIIIDFQNNCWRCLLFLQPFVESGGIEIEPFEKPIIVEEKPLIACIDDSEAIQRIVKMTLMAGGFNVINITEPSKAMSAFVTRRPDLILMDINMPEIDGYKLAYMLRQSTLLKDIPILMLTGRDGILDRVKAKMVGAEAYISKPFNPQELVETVQNNLSKK